MCLITKNKEPNIATTDLYVYKVLRKIIYKPYKLLHCYKKIKYTTPIYEATVKKGCILKAYDPDSIIKPYYNPRLSSNYCVEGQGVHAFIKEKDAEFFNAIGEYNGVITLWKISTGVKYWIDITNERIAATEMQFIKELH